MPKNDSSHFLVSQPGVHVCVALWFFAIIRLHCSTAMWCVFNPIKTSCPELTLETESSKALVYRKSLQRAAWHSAVLRLEIWVVGLVNNMIKFKVFVCAVSWMFLSDCSDLFVFVFQARIKFPIDYPYSPPTFRFLTKMWHPNIYEVTLF